MSCPRIADVCPGLRKFSSRLFQATQKRRRLVLGSALGLIALIAILGPSRIGYSARSNWSGIKTQASNIVERVRTVSSNVLGIAPRRTVEPAPVETMAVEPAAAPMFAACSNGGYTVDIKSSPVIYVDCSKGNNASYVAYVVTNNGSAVSDLWAQLVPAAGDLALSEDGNYHVGPLAAGASTTIYFFVKVNNCADKPSQNMSVKLYTAPPPFGSAASTCTFPYTAKDDVKASANKLDALSATPNPPAIGGLMTIDATGFTGNIGSNGIFAPTPASISTWPADTFKLNDVIIDFYNSPSNINGCDFSGAPTMTRGDTLFLQNDGIVANGNTACYKIHYEFIIQAIETVNTPISPLTWISSGNLQKHNDDYAGTAVLLQPATTTATLAKSASPTSATSLGTINYTITATNSGATAVIFDSFKDTLPTGMTYVNGSSQFNSVAIADPIISGQNQTWSGSFSVPAGGSRTLTFRATLPLLVTCLSFTNNAVAFVGAVQIDSTLSTADNSPATATVTDTLCGANLGITKTDGVSAIDAGGTATYTIVVSNAGPAAANGAIFKDAAATGLTATNVTCGSASGSAACPTVANTTVALMQGLGIVIPTLPSGGSVTFTVTATVTATTGSITNTATITPPILIVDPNGLNNSASDTDTVNPITNLAITKTDGSPTYTAGNAISYTIVVSNNGPSNASGASVSDTIPAVITGTTIGCVATGTASCGTNASSGNSLSYTGVSISSGAANYLTITVSGTVSASATGNLVNTASVAAGSGQTDPTSGNNSATDTDTAAPSTDLGITKTDGSATYAPGAGITYTIVVSNNGPSNASGASVSDTIPAVITGTTIGCVASGTASCGTNASSGNSLSYTGVSISSGVANFLTITVSGTVSVSATGNLVNTATVAAGSGQTDPTSGNNSATDTDNAAPSTDLGITKTDGSATYAPGAGITYTIVVSNGGPSNASGASVSDTIPAVITGTTIGCVASGTASCGTNTGCSPRSRSRL